MPNPITDTPVATEITPDPVTQPTEARFTAEDLQKARSEEKDKVYGRLNDVAEQNKALQSQIQTLLDEQNARREAEEQARRDAEEAARKAAEAELSATDLIAQKERELAERINQTQSEWEQKFQQMQAEREQERALLEKEKEFATLTAYTQQRISAEQDSIAPELLDFVGGNTQAEIDASIDRVKAKSAAIISAMQEAATQQRQQQRGVSPTAGSAGPLEMFSTGQRQYSATDIQNMTIEEYSKFRAQNGIGGGSSARGLYS